ncbi:hypothetical protein IFM89_035947 [Coptis chinensis]|uniref:RNase H type-1 domain-containing protein n=1 Tax=Coptis chinensis TaxID=261450 RepID=A0A835H1K7_9MAGN|nr:hypothetical protein IFM89_035947 [Coptis chinensis]
MVSRIGGIVRDSDGKVLLAYTGAGGCRSVLYQELKAIWAGLQGCKAIQQLKVEVASDLLRAVKIIRHQEIVPWHCANITAAIDQLIRQFVSVNVIHVHWEANRVADHLASLAIDHELEYDPTSSWSAEQFPSWRVAEVNINTDGSARLNAGPAGVAGVHRDDTGPIKSTHRRQQSLDLAEHGGFRSSRQPVEIIIQKNLGLEIPLPGDGDDKALGAGACRRVEMVEFGSPISILLSWADIPSMRPTTEANLDSSLTTVSFSAAAMDKALIPNDKNLDMKNRRLEDKWKIRIEKRDRMMKELHSLGRTIEEIAEVLKRVSLYPKIISAIKSAHVLGCDLRIVSDANHFFIETILKHHGLIDCFSEINTNIIHALSTKKEGLGSYLTIILSPLPMVVIFTLPICARYLNCDP